MNPADPLWNWAFKVSAFEVLWVVAVKYATDFLAYVFGWSKPRIEKPDDHPTLDFPYKILKTADLKAHLANLSRPDIPYVPRLPQTEQEGLISRISRAQHVLLIGRSGLGKTREAVELIERIEMISGEEVTVLLPDGFLEPPLTIPSASLGRTVILLLDDLPARYAEPYRVEDLNNPRLVAENFRLRLEQTFSRFTNHYGTKFRVIATGIGEPALRERLRLGDPFWTKFEVCELPDLAGEQRIQFLTELQNYLGIEITSEAKLDLASRSDGTYSGLIVPVVKESDDRHVTLEDSRKYSCTYPQDWEDRVYQSQFVPNIHRKNLLRSMSILRQVGMTLSAFLVTDLAARLCSTRFIFWHRRKVTREIGLLKDWIRVSGGRLQCPDAYLLGKADPKADKDYLTASVHSFLSRPLKWFAPNYFLTLRGSLYSLINFLAYDAEDFDAALAINKALLELNPDNYHAWSQLAILYVEHRDYAEAEKASQTSIRLCDNSNAWTTLSIIYELQSRYSESINACEKALARDSARSYLWARLGAVLGKAGRFEEAISAGRHAIQLDPLNTMAHVSLGIIFDQAGQLDNARQALEKALEIDNSSAIAWQTLGVVHSRAGHHSRAIKACKTATLLEPKSATAWELLGRTLEDADNHKDAIAAFRLAVDLDQKNPGTWLTYGVALDRANVEGAFEALTTAITLDPSLLNAWQAMLRYFRRHGTRDSQSDPIRWARQDVPALTLRVPTDVRGLLIRAIAANLAGDSLESIRTLKQAIDRHPTSEVAWRALGRMYNELGRGEDALWVAEKLRDLAPGDPGAWYILGLSQNKIGKSAEAIASLKRAAELDSNSVATWRLLGKIYNELGQTADALDVASKAKDLAPNDAESWYVLGISQSKADKIDASIASFQKATKLDPGFVPAWRALIAIYGDLGQIDNASRTAMKLQELAPEQAESWYLLGVSQDKLGLLEDAINSWKKATELNPNFLNAWRALRVAYNKAGRKREALQAAIRGRELSPNNADAWYVLGLCQDAVGQTVEAVESLKEATRLEPNLVDAWRVLAALYKKLGRVEEVLVVTSHLVTLCPNDPKRWFRLASTYEESQRFQEAIQSYEQVTQLPHSEYTELALEKIKVLTYRKTET